MIANELDYWLEMLRHRRWMLHLGGPDHRHPVWIAATLQWPTCADVVIIRSEEDATAFRVPTNDTTDLLHPGWGHLGLLGIGGVDTSHPPGSPGEPMFLMTAPEVCRIPRDGRRPVTTRPL